MKLKNLTEDDKGRTVWYKDGVGDWELGILKSWNNTFVFVVYPGNNDSKKDHWDRYTGVATKPSDLFWNKK